MTIDEDELPRHVDSYFVGYANHSTVLLAGYVIIVKIF